MYKRQTQQSSFSLSSEKSFNIRTDFLNSLLDTKQPLNKFKTPKKQPPGQKDFHTEKRSKFSPLMDLRPKYLEKFFLFGNNTSGSFSNSSFNDIEYNESQLGMSDNQSMLSFNSKLKSFDLMSNSNNFANYKSKNIVVRFNAQNSSTMPLHLKKKYFSLKNNQKFSSLSSSSFPDELASISGIINPDFVNKCTTPKLIGAKWSANLYAFRYKIEKNLSLPKELIKKCSNPNLTSILNSLCNDQRESSSDFNIKVNNKNLGYILMLLSMNNHQGSPELFSMLLIKAFRNSKSQVRSAIFDSLCNVLKNKLDSQLDAQHKKLISDVLFVIFLEDRNLFLGSQISDLLFENGINHLAFLIMGEMLGDNADSKKPQKKKSKKVKISVNKNLEMNVSRLKIEKAGVNAEKYFRLCEILGLKQEKWGLYESLFESEKQAVKLLKLKENKHYLPFVEYIEENPDAVSYTHLTLPTTPYV